MMTRYINRNDVLMVDAGGGQIEQVDSDGVVVAVYAVKEGRQRASVLYDLAGGNLLPGQGVAVFPPRSLTAVLAPAPELLHATAANPDFRVTNASRVARELERKLNSVSVLERRMARLARAQERALAVPDATEDATEVDESAEAVEADADDAGAAS
jgi:hypothetical protein